MSSGPSHLNSNDPHYHQQQQPMNSNFYNNQPQSPQQQQQQQYQQQQKQQQQQQQQSQYHSQPQPQTTTGYYNGPSPYAQAPQYTSPVGFDGAGRAASETDFLKANVSGQLGLQIGTQVINAGQDYVNRNITQKIPMGRLKTYFNVTNMYVLRKLSVILFPFRHKAWQRTVQRDASGQIVAYNPPREDINSPDLYIPAMAAVTYILLVGVILGLRKSFHPEKLGVTATGAVVFILCELLLVKLGAYLLSLGNDVSILDMLAIIGYNFIPLIITLLVDLFLGKWSRTIVFIYCSIAMAFFMLRSLRYSFLPDTSTPLVVNQRRTRVHFLFGVVFVQIVCSYFLLV